MQSKSNAPKPNKRKTWRKSTIQLVPAAPASGQAENQSVKESNAVENNAEAKPESSTTETNIPLKLPRAMRSASSNISNPLRVKNSEHGEEPVVQKESGEPARRSPLRRTKKTEEKENFNH